MSVLPIAESRGCTGQKSTRTHTNTEIKQNTDDSEVIIAVAISIAIIIAILHTKSTANVRCCCLDLGRRDLMYRLDSYQFSIACQLRIYQWLHTNMFVVIRTNKILGFVIASAIAIATAVAILLLLLLLLISLLLLPLH